jgi:hypothetical protein
VTVKVNDREWKKLKGRLDKLGRTGAHVQVGVFSTAGAHADSGVSMVEIAAVHEFGSPSANIPQRSFIRAGILESREELKKVLAKLAKGVVQDRIQVDEALQQLGLWGANAVKRKVTGTNIPPPLATATIRRKGSSKPLVDTGQLVNSITWVVVP